MSRSKGIFTMDTKERSLALAWIQLIHGAEAAKALAECDDEDFHALAIAALDPVLVAEKLRVAKDARKPE